MLIIEVETLHVHKTYDDILGGVVRDLAFSTDSQKLMVAGEGKQVFAKVIEVETGSGKGEIMGISKKILTGDLR